MLTILIISLILLAGCGGECKKSSDCPPKTCYVVKCIKKQCVETPKEDCCGNDFCDKGETECSCERDCGKCEGKVGIYLENLCEGKECVTDINPELINKSSFTDKISIRNVGDISSTYTYDKPFNIDESVFNVRLVLENKMNEIDYIKINKVNIYQEIGRRTSQVQTLGEKIIDQTLWDTRTPISEDIILKLPSNISEEEKTITVEIIYEYGKFYRGDVVVTPGNYKKQLQDKLYFVNPTKKQKCPASCDDDNPCTTDSCSSATNYFCEHKVKEGISCCGNHECDANEDKCSCQQDCGFCEREYGNYIEYACIANKCSSRLKADPVPKTLIEEANMNDIRIEMKTTFNEPFDIGSDRFKVTLELKQISTTVSNIECTELQVLSGDELLAEKDMEADDLDEVGDDYSTEFTADFSMQDVEEKKGTSMKLTCTYDKTVNDVTASYSRSDIQSLDQITYVSPDV